ncbi:thyrotropin-releasing hormone-degrading ectoenzyme-like isoform X2 [Linepithema humile]|uniref:thyrotropin-releasing hormone-degrading ectoenzyme-like isoform X2 n=1 Tax=Linepithema humile TaxID=83485 RepID=UPI00351F78FD
MNMIFRKLLTNGEIMLIATIALCTAAVPKIETPVYSPDLAPVITPVHYDAKIRFSYKTNDIIGECNITILINRRTKKISMHPVIFAIFQIDLYDNLSKEQINIPRYSFNNKLNKLTIDFSNTPKLAKFLSPGRYTLQIAYIRHINNDKKHFSASSHSNKTIWKNNMLNATGLDVMTAQQLFPCWGNLRFNSTYKISIKHHKYYSALSNMPVQTTENDDKSDMMWTHFEKSPLMFIQHLKFVITTFTKVSTSAANITLWSRKDTINYLQLAQCISEQILHFLTRENSALAKISKIDYVVFWDTQHNNSLIWGLILQSEFDILHDEDLYPVGHKFKVSYLITNQIVSLWYNDVILWSKTGFITFLAAYIFYQIPSENDILNLFIVETQRKSFVFNTASNANKKNALIHSLDHIKSTNVWRILYHLITADVFWTGICTYVTNKQYNQTDNLWDIIQTILRTYPNNSSVLILNKLISVWIAEQYYPVLYVTRNYFINKTTFEYSSYSFIDDTEHLSAFVTYTTKSNMNFHDIFVNKSFWLSPEKPKRLVQKFDENDWIIVNLQQTGYYRVNYDTDNWLKLAQYMNSTRYFDIHILNRAQIIDDAFYFLIHKQLDYTVFWKISEFLSRETNYVVWYAMFKAFEYITVMIPIQKADNVKEKMEKILTGVLQKIGYYTKPYESDLIERLREEAVRWACVIGNKECRNVASMQMKKNLYPSNYTSTMQSEWKEWMYCNGLMSADHKIMYEIYTKWAEIRDNQLLEYLTCNRKPEMISAYLTLNSKDNYLLHHRNTRAHIILLTVAKHARNNIICDFVLQNLNQNTLMFTSNTQRDKIAILIVIITHQHAVKQLNKQLMHS